MNRFEAKEKATSCDCNCVAGKDRGSNFDAVIDEVFDLYDKLKQNQDLMLKVDESLFRIAKIYKKQKGNKQLDAELAFLQVSFHAILDRR